MNVLVIGLGEIGKPLLEIVRGTYNAFGLDIQQEEIKEKIDVMHICLPYSKNFVSDVVDYIRRFQPKLTLIESTVLPATTKKIHSVTGGNICHSPVRARDFYPQRPDLPVLTATTQQKIGMKNIERQIISIEHQACIRCL